MFKKLSLRQIDLTKEELSYKLPLHRGFQRILYSVSFLSR